MATRAERFRYSEQRSKPPLPKLPKKKRLNVGTKKPRGLENGTLHEHTGLKGDRKASVVLEENLSGRPSRKSTRKSSNGQLSGGAFEHVRRMTAANPQHRHERRGA